MRLPNPQQRTHAMSGSARRRLTIRFISVGNGWADTYNSIASDSEHSTPLIARWEIFVSGRGHLPLFVKHGRGAVSWKATAWAAGQTTGAARRKLLLLALANYADETGVCWPSQETLARDTEQSVDNVSANSMCSRTQASQT